MGHWNPDRWPNWEVRVTTCPGPAVGWVWNKVPAPNAAAAVRSGIELGHAQLIRDQVKGRSRVSFLRVEVNEIDHAKGA